LKKITIRSGEIKTLVAIFFGHDSGCQTEIGKRKVISMIMEKDLV